MEAQDRRQHVRKALIANARIVAPGGAQIPCDLQNVSDAGAMLSFDRPLSLPPFFTFQVEGNLTVSRKCELRWQDGVLAGVRFVCRTKKRRRIPAAA